MSTNLQHIDKYELHTCLAYNDMTRTWKALDTQTQRIVILKLYTLNQPDLLAHFLYHVRAVASLQHPNIAHIYDTQTSAFLVPPKAGHTAVYLVREYIEGPTLAEYIAHTSGVKRFPTADEIVYLFSALGSAIDYAHQHGVIHRNLKPSNILLKPGGTYQLGEPVLTDFGMGGSRDVPRAGTGQTPPLPYSWTSGWSGTPLYVSPEQAKGYIGNELSDIYTLGVMLYEVCTGAPPFQGTNAGAILSQHVNALPPSPVLINSMIPPALAEVILHSIAKDPTARYSNALSMANALADAFNLPLPENLTMPDYLFDQMSAPTIFKPQPTHSLPYQTPLSPSQPDFVPAAPFPAIASTPRPTAPMSNTPGTSITQRNSNQGAISGNPVSILPMAEVSPFSLPITPHPPARSRKRLFVALIALLIFVLAGSGLGAFLLLNHPASTTTATNSIAGYTYFVSSGQVNESSTQGINDELLVELRNVSSSAPGKSYYAWLLSDTSQVDGTALLLGKLTIIHGSVRFPYLGDAQHDNLLARFSRFLVTQEDASVTPTNPTPDHSAWVYYVELPQKANPADPNRLSMLDHLRDLLSDDPALKALGLTGGLDIWLYRNTEKILEWSGSARDYWGNPNSLPAMRSQFVRILDYLDGATAVQQDLPGVPVIANKTEGAIGLLGQNQEPAGFLQLIGGHLSGIVQAPGVTLDREKIADQINAAINNVRNWLEHVYQDVKQLYQAGDAQLLQASSLAMLDDMVNYALSAYVGHLDPSTAQVQEGVVQIHDSIQRLASFDIATYTAGG